MLYIEKKPLCQGQFQQHFMRQFPSTKKVQTHTVRTESYIVELQKLFLKLFLKLKQLSQFHQHFMPQFPFPKK